MIDFQKLFTAGKEAGLTEMEVYLVENESFSCEVFEQVVDSYSVSSTRGLSLRALYQDKMGYIYTEVCDDSAIDYLINGVITNAAMIEKSDQEEIYAGDADYVSLNLYRPAFTTVSPTAKINFLKTVEAECKASDSRVKSVNYCLFTDDTENVSLKNSKGLNLSQKRNHAHAYVSVLVSEKGENKTQSDYIIGTDFSKYEPKAFAKKLVSEAIAQLGAITVPSGNYPVLLKNTVAASILEAMRGCFSAELIQKDLSYLKGKLNEQIGSPLLSIIDDPHFENGLHSTAFDGEGVATYTKEVVTAGKLATYLHSLATAKAFNVRPTGNGFRSSFKSPVTISPSNMYIKPLETTFTDLLSAIGNGVYITDIQGLHAGLNDISGDFSLSANGFLIADSKIASPIHEITVAGNFFDLLQEIKGIGNDLAFEVASVGSPSLWIESLTISGE